MRVKESEEDGYIIINGKEMAKESHAQNDSPKYLTDIDQCIDGLEDVLWPLNKFIHENPELAFKEYKAHDALTKFMSSQEGWEVTRSAYGLETAWTAVYDTGRKGPVASFNVEMDALPNLGHACGHNLIAIASLSAALATAHILSTHYLPGCILLVGTPGEEGYGGGKIQLLRAGAYADASITLISHPGLPNNSPLIRTTAFARLEASYTGRAAHAANAPWDGINALDALVTAYTAVSNLRQQLRPDDVVGVQITDGGNAPNTIHAHAAGLFVLRAASSARLAVLRNKVEHCLRAGAEATSATLALTYTPGYADHVPNRPLAGLYTSYFNALAPPPPAIPPAGSYTFVKASTDQGDLSYALPSLNASFAIEPAGDGGRNHTADFEVASGRRGAFERALRVGKALAGVGVGVCADERVLGEVREAWRRDMDEMRGKG